MELTAKVLQVLPLQTGVGKENKSWKKQEVLFDQGGTFPKKVVVAFWGTMADISFNVGATFNLKIDVESREFNGKYYTDVKGWAATEVQPASQPKPVSANNAQVDREKKFDTPSDAREASINAPVPEDDLPF
jgi:hypothetical protein